MSNESENETKDLKAVDPRQLELKSPRDEFLNVVSSRLARLESEGEEELIELLLEAKELGVDWLPERPGGESR